MTVDASKIDYQTFGKAQLDVYGEASFGWAYWSFKNANNAWSLKWNIENEYLLLGNISMLIFFNLFTVNVCAACKITGWYYFLQVKLQANNFRG